MQKLVRWLADEEQYHPIEDEQMEVGEDRYGGDFSDRDIGLFTSSKNIAKRPRGGPEPEGIDQPARKKIEPQNREGGHQRPRQRKTVVGTD